MDRVYVMQLVHSYRYGYVTRREFLRRATVALGSLATAQMLLAACASSTATPPATAPQPDATSSVGAGSTGVIVEEVSYHGSDGQTLMGYLARPEGEGIHPAVIVIQEWWGLNTHIEDVVRRFAREGFIALAPDLYHGEVVSEPDEAQKLVMELDMAEAVNEIRQAIAFLQGHPFVGSEQVGVVGFCLGGGLALQTALVEEAVGAAVAFYGRPLSPAQAREVKAPVLGIYGEADRGIPVAQVRIMGDALTEVGIENEIHIYPGAGHAFFNDTRTSYDHEASADDWQRTLTWFRERL